MELRKQPLHSHPTIECLLLDESQVYGLTYTDAHGYWHAFFSEAPIMEAHGYKNDRPMIRRIEAIVAGARQQRKCGTAPQSYTSIPADWVNG